MTVFNGNQIRSLEDKLLRLLGETVEVLQIGERTHGKLGYMAYVELDNGNKCYVEFNAWLLPDEIFDLDIYSLMGRFTNPIDESIFVDEPKVDY